MTKTKVLKVSEEDQERILKLINELGKQLPTGVGEIIQVLTNPPEAKWITVHFIVGHGNDDMVSALEQFAQLRCKLSGEDYETSPQSEGVRNFLKDVRQLPRVPLPLEPPIGQA